MPSRVTLSLDPVRNPENLLRLIDALARRGDTCFKSYAEITACIRQDYHYTRRSEPLALARLLGLLTRGKDGFALSPTALAIHAARTSARIDLLHFLLYTAWKPGAVRALGVSWAYRACCDRLWTSATTQLDRAAIVRLQADIVGAAEDQFQGTAMLSFGGKGVRGIRRWLAALDTTVLTKGEFCRRDHCSRELLLLALGWVSREDGSSLGTDILLTDMRRAAICRVCLLESVALDARLDHLLEAYPQVLAAGTRTGAYGRFFRLHTFPTIERLRASAV